jgi:hypothetical protein
MHAITDMGEVEVGGFLLEASPRQKCETLSEK